MDIRCKVLAEARRQLEGESVLWKAVAVEYELSVQENLQFTQAGEMILRS